MLRGRFGAKRAPAAGDPGADAAGVITLTGDDEAVWAQLLAARPPRFCNDLFNLAASGRIVVGADPVRLIRSFRCPSSGTRKSRSRTTMRGK